MSGAALSYVRRILDDGSTLTVSQRLIALLLADHASASKNEAWPSVPTLARLAGLADRNVQHSLRALELAGVVKAIPRRGRTTIYRFPPGDYLSTPVTPASPPDGDTGDASVTPPPTPASPHPRRQRHPIHSYEAFNEPRTVPRSESQHPCIVAERRRSLSEELADGDPDEIVTSPFEAPA